MIRLSLEHINAKSPYTDEFDSTAAALTDKP